MNALAREPNNRFDSAGALTEALKAAVDALPPETSPFAENDRPTIPSPVLVTPEVPASPTDQEPGRKAFGQRVANWLGVS